MAGNQIISRDTEPSALLSALGTTRQAGNDTSTSEMGSDWISLEWSHFSGNRPAWCKNWKRRKERRWLRFLRHLLGGWHCIVGTASTEPQMCGFCLPARHHQDPRLPPRVFIQSYSSESSLRLRPLPKWNAIQLGHRKLHLLLED